MNWIDIIFITIILWFAFKGYKRGFVMELTGIASLILAILGAINYKYIVGRVLAENFTIKATYIPLLSFVLTFLIILVTVSLVGSLLTKLLKTIHLGFVNRILGGVFAAAKVIVVLAIFVIFVDWLDSMFHFLKRETTQNSFCYTQLKEIAQYIYRFSEKQYGKLV